MNYKSGLLLSVIILSFDFICGMESDQKEDQVQKKMKLDLSMLYINDKNEKTDKFECFLELPIEIQVYIIKYLNFMDIKNFRLANKELKVLISDKDFNERKKLANKLGLELMNAAKCKDYWKSKEIINSGNAKLDLQDKDGWTTLIRSSRWGYLQIVNLLINAKANLDLKNNSGHTALIYASYWGDTEVVKLLIDAKANLDLQNNDGCTALMEASYTDQTDTTKIVKLLIKAGANLDLKDNDGQTAFEKARYDEIKNIIKKAMENKK